MQIVILKDFECDHIIEHIKYPDGQRSLRLNLEILDIKEPITIKCRITSFAALEYLMCLISALRKNDFHIYEINFIYLIGMRSDRGFSIGGPNYFRDVIAPIINSMKINRINFYYPHSRLSASAVDKSFVNFDYPEFKGNPLFIKGDQHAEHCSEYFFDKKRNGRDKIDVTLRKDFIKSIASERADRIIIVDDLCDAGGTFIAEAKYLLKHFPENTLELYVVHGLFTKGIDPLLEHFSHIYCSNSYQDIDHPRLTQFKVI